MIFWLNGTRRSPEEPLLSALDRGFTLADGLFETMRAHHGIIFRLDAHLERLCAGAHLLGIPLVDGLRDHIASSALEAASAGYEHAGVRLTMSRGPAAGGLAPPARPTPTVTLAISEITNPGASHPLAAVIAHGRRNEYALTSGIKTLAYTESIIALAQAHAAGADEAIFLDTGGHVSEATASNLFAVIDDVLVTPPLHCGVLAGITRAAVLELAPALALHAIEREIDEPELERASEIFLTSSIRAIAPVIRIGDSTIGAGKPGPITARITAAYDALVLHERQP